MWRWLPNELCNKSLICLSKRKIFFLQLCGLVFALHMAVFLFYGLCVWLFSEKQRFNISLSQKGMTYVLMPLQKKVDQPKNARTGAASNKKSNVIDMATYEKKKKSHKKQYVQAKTTTSKKTAEAKKVVASKPQPKKEQASVIMRDVRKKLKSTKTKKVSIKMQETVDVAIANVAEKSVAKEIEKSKMVEQPVVPVAEVNVPVVEADADDFDPEQVIFVGYEELDRSLIGSKIQQTVQQHWTPPVGMTQGVTCDIQVKINGEGQALETKIMTSSGIFVYDASARKTLQNIEYPKEVWNKTITIALGAS